MKIITKRYTLKDTSKIKNKTHFPEELIEKIYSAAKDYGVVPDEAIFLRKGYEQAKSPDFSDAERSAVNYITTGRKDRDNEVVCPDGIILDEYRKTPVVLAFHKYDQLPVGKNLWIKQDSPLTGLIAKTQYAKHEEAMKIFNYRKDGFPLATSIGFIPIDFVLPKSKHFAGEIQTLIGKGWVSQENSQDISAIIKKCVLLEYSDVSVPSNPDAVQLAVSKGIKEFVAFDNLDGMDIEAYEMSKEKDVDEEISFTETIVEMKPAPEETEDSIRIRIRDPKLFKDNSFRTMTFRKESPMIKAVIGKFKEGDSKSTNVQSLIFPKSEGWTKKSATKWVKDHKDGLGDKSLIKSLDDIFQIFLKEYETENLLHSVDNKTLDKIFEDLKAKSPLGIKGEMSVKTLSGILQTWCDKNSNSMEMSNYYSSISDIFPTKYPSKGYFIWEKYNMKERKAKYYKCEYVINVEDESVEVKEQGEVAPQYTEKEYEAEIESENIPEARIVREDLKNGEIIIDALGLRKINLGIDLHSLKENEKKRKEKIKEKLKNFVSISAKDIDEWKDIFSKFEDFVSNYDLGEDGIKEFCKSHNLLYKGIDNIEDIMKNKDKISIEIFGDEDVDKSSLSSKQISVENKNVTLFFGKVNLEDRKKLLKLEFDRNEGWTDKSAMQFIVSSDINSLIKENEISKEEVMGIMKSLIEQNNGSVMESFSQMLAKAMGKVQM